MLFKFSHFGSDSVCAVCSVLETLPSTLLPLIFITVLIRYYILRNYQSSGLGILLYPCNKSAISSSVFTSYTVPQCCIRYWGTVEQVVTVVVLHWMWEWRDKVRRLRWGWKVTCWGWTVLGSNPSGEQYLLHASRVALPPLASCTVSTGSLSCR